MRFFRPNFFNLFFHSFARRTRVSFSVPLYSKRFCFLPSWRVFFSLFRVRKTKQLSRVDSLCVRGGAQQVWPETTGNISLMDIRRRLTSVTKCCQPEIPRTLSLAFYLYTYIMSAFILGRPREIAILSH